MAVFMELHSQRKFDKSYNATFVSLIPKKVGAVDVKHFQPISLLGGVYKILSQVLANRLKSVLGKISSNSYNAFIGGRQISDLVLITRKCAVGRVFGKISFLYVDSSSRKNHDLGQFTKNEYYSDGLVLHV
jgi:hypothetical protein